MTLNNLIKVVRRRTPTIFLGFWGLTWTLSVMGVYNYSELSNIFFFLVFQFFLLFTIISGLLLKLGFWSQKEESKEEAVNYRILFRFSLLVLPLTFLLVLVAAVIDQAHYRNYIFSKTHLQPKNLYWVLVLSAYIFWFQHEKSWKNQLSGKSRFSLTRRVILIGFAIWILFFNFRFTSSEIFKNLYFMVRHPFATYDEKMTAGWGDVYNFMIFVKQNTPPNASIVIPPPEAPWNNEGSGPLMTAFLYPRRIVQREKDENKIDLNADYAIVAWGWWGCGKEGLDRDEKECHGWPRVKVPAEWVIYKEKDSMRTIKKIVNTAYDPQSQENKSAWGLIKIKKGQ